MSPVAATEQPKRKRTAAPKSTVAATPKPATAASHKHATKKTGQVSEPAPELPAPIVSREAIAELAYSYWEARGFQGGSPDEDWLRAERALLIPAQNS